jgi:hypothetical protein
VTSNCEACLILYSVINLIPETFTKDSPPERKMLAQFDIMQHLYTNFRRNTDPTLIKWYHISICKSLFLKGMFVSVCLDCGLIKLWCGKYLEIDNFIVHPEHRKEGISKIMTNYVDIKAKN